MQFQTYPDAVIPGLAFGLHGSNPQPVAHGSGSLSREAWDSVCYDPHLQWHHLSSSPSSRLRRSQENLFYLLWSDLVQRSHRHLGGVARDELPGRALRVAGGDSLSVPQVTCMGRHEELTAIYFLFYFF